MKNNILFKGIYPALISPVDENGVVKEEELRKLLRWEMSFGIDGFYLCGSTGEGFLMSPVERKKMLEITLDEVKGKVKVIANTGDVDLKTTLDLTKHASKVGADAVSSVPPIYYVYGQEEVYNFYKEMALAAGNIPLLIYAYGPSGALSLDMIKRLMKIDNIIGLKWTNPNYYLMLQIKEIEDGNINVINGPDETLICGLSVGADAGIGTTYNIMPGVFVDLFKAFNEGRIEEAKKLQKAISSVITIMIEYHAIAATKAMLNEIGFNVGQCIKPLRQLDEKESKELFRRASEFIDFKTQKLVK